MGISRVTKDYIKKFASTPNNHMPVIDIKNGIMVCPTKKRKKKDREISITKFEFFDLRDQKIEGIDKEGKVKLQLEGKNLDGKQLVIDFLDQNNIKFYYPAVEENQTEGENKTKEITNEYCLLLDMNGDKETIELYAEFIIK